MCVCVCMLRVCLCVWSVSIAILVFDYLKTEHCRLSCRLSLSLTNSFCKCSFVQVSLRLSHKSDCKMSLAFYNTHNLCRSHSLSLSHSLTYFGNKCLSSNIKHVRSSLNVSVWHPLNGLFLFLASYKTEKSLGIADDAFALRDKPKASERLRI